PIPPAIFAQLLATQRGSIGAQLDCVLDVGRNEQQMRISRADVSAASDSAQPIFVAAAHSALVLPKDGSWRVAQHTQRTVEVAPLAANLAVPLIRRGKLNSKTGTTDAVAADLLRIADPVDLVQPPTSNSRHYGLLQSTRTQKALFRQPSFQEGVKQLLGAPP